MFKGREKQIYNKGYYSGFINATKKHLGNKCFKCNTTENLEIHHKNNLKKNIEGGKIMQIYHNLYYYVQSVIKRFKK